jgi:hypothetical protein
MKNSELKSKIMALGNRLSSRMDRRAAFKKAWEIVRTGGIELPVKGVTFGLRQLALKRLSAYRSESIVAYLVTEYENTVDNRATKVMIGVQNGKGLFNMGYLPKEYAPAAQSLHVAGVRVIGNDDIRGCRLALTA